MSINSIRLQNFKGFKDATLPLKPLTVILGPNSSGKSCFGQALVALSKSNARSGALSLAFDEKESVEFGSYSELIHNQCQGENILIDLGLGDDIIRLGFGPGDKNAGIGELSFIYEATLSEPLSMPDQSSQIINIEEAIHRKTLQEWNISTSTSTDESLQNLNFEFNGINIHSLAKLTKTGVDPNDVVPTINKKNELLASLLRGISYIRPDRIAPERRRPIPPGEIKIDDFGDGTELFIHNSRKDKFDCFFFPDPSPDKDENKKRLKDYDDSTHRKVELIEILNEWLTKLGLVKSFDIKLLENGKYTQATATPLNQEISRPLTDIGFGVSQVLPILVKGITIKKNDWLIVEQPEAQLHPKPQAGLADFFCSMVKCGRNVIVETHSVELFHRLRLRASMDNDLADKIGVYFMHQPVDGACCDPEPVPLREESELDWPEGFLPEGIKSEMEILATRLARMEMD